MTIHNVKTAHKNVPLIQDGLKTATVRYEYEGKVKPGDVFIIEDAETGERVAQRDVLHAARMPAGDALGFIHDFGHKYPHDNIANLLRALNGHYDGGIGIDTEVLVTLYEGPPERIADDRPVRGGDEWQ